MNCSFRFIKINFFMGVEVVKFLYLFKVLNLLIMINKMEKKYKLNIYLYVVIDCWNCWKVKVDNVLFFFL